MREGTQTIRPIANTCLGRDRRHSPRRDETEQGEARRAVAGEPARSGKAGREAAEGECGDQEREPAAADVDGEGASRLHAAEGRTVPARTGAVEGRAHASVDEVAGSGNPPPAMARAR